MYQLIKTNCKSS